MFFFLRSILFSLLFYTCVHLSSSYLLINLKNLILSLTLWLCLKVPRFFLRFLYECLSTRSTLFLAFILVFLLFFYNLQLPLAKYCNVILFLVDFILIFPFPPIVFIIFFFLFLIQVKASSMPTLVLFPFLTVHFLPWPNALPFLSKLFASLPFSRPLLWVINSFVQLELIIIVYGDLFSFFEPKHAFHFNYFDPNFTANFHFTYYD
jgi:hypothetical protein